MTFSTLGNSLKDRMKKEKSLQKHVDAARILEVASSIFSELFGEQQAALVKPLYVKNRTLTITCGSSAIAQEIRLNQGPIVEKINTILGKTEVDRIRYLA